MTCIAGVESTICVVRFMRRSAALLLAAVALAWPGCRTDDDKCSGSGLRTVRPGWLVVGASDNPPFVFRDLESGQVTGFEAELLREAAKRLRLDIRFVDQSTPGLLTGLLAERYDVAASGVLISGPTSLQVCFADPHLDADLALLLGAGVTREVAGLDEVSDSVPLLVEERGRAERWAAEHLDRPIETRPTLQDVLDELGGDEPRAALLDYSQARFHLRTADALRLAERIDTGQSYGLAVHPSNGGLRSALNRALRDMRQDRTLRRIGRKFGM